MPPAPEETLDGGIGDRDAAVAFPKRPSEGAQRPGCGDGAPEETLDGGIGDRDAATASVLSTPGSDC
jgi:hypothetical protein